jgi:signal transduction histidine kinase
MVVANVQTESHATVTDLDRRAWNNWLRLAFTAVLSILGLAVGAVPLILGREIQFWPWAHTDILLLIGLPIVVVLPVVYLTRQQQKLLEVRSANAELQRELERRAHIEERLRWLNNVLEERAQERSVASRQQERQLQQANAELSEKKQKLEEMNNAAHHFVDNVSHEFRTPLTVIKEYASGLKEALADDVSPDVEQFFDVIINRADDLSVMVCDLLDVSRLEADILRMSRRDCRVDDIIRQVQHTLERKALRSDVLFTVDIDDNMPHVYCDPEKIGRVIVNLAVNAMKDSSGSGSVRLWARHEKGRNEVEIGVTDDGPGIPEEECKLIFERFQRLETEHEHGTRGFGLGLSIAKELVALNLGEIQVDSTVGKGSTFSFSVPTAEPADVLARYLERIRRGPEPPMCVSLVSLRTDSSAPTQLLTEVQAFLENHLRRGDLLFRQRRGSWLLAASTNQKGAKELVRRLEAVHRQANESRLTSPLPALRSDVRGTWSISSQTPELLRSFESALCRLPDMEIGMSIAPAELPSSPT